MSELKEKVVTSALATYFLKLFSTGLTFFTSIILARLLIPDEFGLFALALVVVSFTSVFLDLGVSNLAVREKNVNYGNIWLLRISLTFIAIIIILVFVNQFSFLNSGVPRVLRILILSLIPTALIFHIEVFLYKELELRKGLLAEFCGFVTYPIIAITLASLNYGIWSLVFAYIVSGIVTAFTKWWIVRRKIEVPFNFDFNDFFPMIYRAKFFFLLAIFAIISKDIDKLIMGKLSVPINEIGYYTFAWGIFAMLGMVFVSAVKSITYPLFSKFKDDDLALGDIFVDVTTIYYIFSPAYIFLIFNAKTIIRILFGEKWLPMTPFLQIFCLMALVAIFSIFGYHLFQAKKKENWVLYLNILYSICLIVISIPLIRLLSAEGMALSRLLITLLIVTPLEGLLVYYITKKSLLLIRRLLVFIVPPFVLMGGLFLLTNNETIRFIFSGFIMIFSLYYIYKQHMTKIIKKYFLQKYSIKGMFEMAAAILK